MSVTSVPTQAQPTRLIDARGSFCPGPLMELIRAIRESQVGDVIAVWQYRHIFSMRKANEREQARIGPYFEI